MRSLLILGLVASCDVASPEPGRFVHQLSSCSPDPIFNCSPSLTIEAEGQATLIVTDIVNSGTIVIDGARWKWTADGAADVPATIYFTPSDGDQVLTDDFTHWDWHKTAQ